MDQQTPTVRKGTLHASRCTLNSTKRCLKVVDALRNACGFILIHNHPSGDPNPSQEDRDITARLKEAAALMGVPLLDHIGLGDKTFFSFADTDATWKS